MADEPSYQIAISFAGEQRGYAAQLTKQLQARGVKVFYDEDHLAALWGKDLSEELHRIYSKDASYVVMLVSEAYCQKMWTRHERRAALEKALALRSEYILPIRFDDDAWPEGMSKNIHYMTSTAFTEAQIASLLCTKLNVPQPPKASHVPPPQLTSIIGTVELDHSSHNGRYTIGTGTLLFELVLQGGIVNGIRAYNDAPSVNGVAIAYGAKSFTDIVDASSYDFTSRSRDVRIGEYLVVRNSSGFYAVLKVEAAKHRSHGAEQDYLKFFYVIADDGSADFSDYAVFE